jgi:hypothetical protein
LAQENLNVTKRILVDGRVFSTAAHDRGMGRYVRHLLDLLKRNGHKTTLLLFRDSYLSPDDALHSRYSLRFANFEAEPAAYPKDLRLQQNHQFTAYLTGLIEQDKYDVYIDSTPFLLPGRYDLFSCAVVAVCYDFIPLKHPDHYLSSGSLRHPYYNGLARLAKADHVICISETVREECKRYLAIPEGRLSVISPTLEDAYAAPLPTFGGGDAEQYLFAILGSHKAKNPQGSLDVYRQLLKAGDLARLIRERAHERLASVV